MTYEEVKKIRQMSTYNCPQELCTYNETGCSDCRVTRAIVLIDEAIEKQIPKKPKQTEVIYGVDVCGEVTDKLILYTCPVCGEVVQYREGCHNNECRQKIDWSDEE